MRCSFEEWPTIYDGDIKRYVSGSPVYYHHSNVQQNHQSLRCQQEPVLASNRTPPAAFQTTRLPPPLSPFTPNNSTCPRRSIDSLANRNEFVDAREGRCSSPGARLFGGTRGGARILRLIVSTVRDLTAARTTVRPSASQSVGRSVGRLVGRQDVGGHGSGRRDVAIRTRNANGDGERALEGVRHSKLPFNNPNCPPARRPSNHTTHAHIHARTHRNTWQETTRFFVRQLRSLFPAVTGN